MIPRLVLDAKPKTLPVTAHNSAHHTVRAAIACCRLAQGSKRSLQGRFWRRSTYPREISQEFPRPSKPEDAFPDADQEEETAIHDLLYWLVQNGGSRTAASDAARLVSQLTHDTQREWSEPLFADTVCKVWQVSQALV